MTGCQTMCIITTGRRDGLLPENGAKGVFDEKSRGIVQNVLRNVCIISFTFSDKCGNIIFAISYCITLKDETRLSCRRDGLWMFGQAEAL